MGIKHASYDRAAEQMAKITMKNYEKCAQTGDCYIPEIKLQPVENKALNKYGRMRRAFLQKQKSMFFDDLVLTE